MKKIALIVVLVLAAPACLGSDFSDSLEGEWRLESGSLSGEEIPILDTHPLTMRLEGGQVTGTAACNGYGGEYSVSGSQFSLDEGLAITEMACQPSEVMTSERMFVDAMAAVDEILLTNMGLLLRGPDAELAFSAVEG